jgi:hypothetical protein
MSKLKMNQDEKFSYPMRNPLDWVLGFMWMLYVKAFVKINPRDGSLWMSLWIQPYWMRCMGFSICSSGFHRT